MRYRSPIQTYTALPPKWRVIYSEDYSKPPAERYLGKIDTELRQTQQAVAGNAAATDLVSLVFTNQALTHAFKSKHMAQLLTERKTLAQKHLADVQWRLEELLEKRPLRLPYSAIGSGTSRDRTEQEVQRQILDLERQKRDIELMLWRDTLELRREVVDERREYKATRDRISFLTGGDHAGS